MSSDSSTTSTTGVLRIPGLGYEGVSWQDLTDKLLEAEKTKFNRLQKWKADWRTRQEAFTRLKTELTTMQSELQKLSSADKFLVKSYVSSKPAVASATLSEGAVKGDYTLHVEQCASKGISSIETGISNKFQSINNGTAQSLSYSYNGKSYEINVPSGTTLEGLKNIINNHPVASKQMSASLINGGNGYILQVSTKNMGAGNSITFNTGGSDFHLDGLKATERWSASKTINTSTLDQIFTSSSKGQSIYNDSNWALNEQKKTSGPNNTPAADYNPNYGDPKPTKFYWQEGNPPTEYSVSVPDGTTLDGLVNIINNSKQGTAKAQLVQKGTGDSATYTLQMTSESNVVVADTGHQSTGESDTAYTSVFSNQFKSSTTTVTSASVNPDAVVATGEDQKFTWTDSAGEHSITVPNGTTTRGLINLINDESPGTAELVGNSTNGFQLQLKDSVVDTTKTSLGGLSNSSSGNWVTEPGQNAQYTINGWPKTGYYESATNELKDVEPGITFNLKGKGDTTISVDLDTEKITENVESFIESINKVRKTFQELTKFDDSKEVLAPDNADSQFEMQKGGVLTGNYGAQMIESTLKQIISSTGAGFVTPLNAADSNGDIFSSLSQIGITTNSDEGSDNYGLLELRKTSSDATTKWTASNFNDALTQDPEAVAKLFSASTDDGVTRAKPDFSYDKKGSQTKSGTYEVEYKVDANGELEYAKIGDSIYDVNATSDSNRIIWSPTKKTLMVSNTGAAEDRITLHLDTMLNDTSFKGSVTIGGNEGKASSKGAAGDQSYCTSSSGITYSGAAPTTKAGTYDVRYHVTMDSSVNPATPIVTGTINGQEAVYENGIFKMKNSVAKDDAKGVEVVLNNLEEGDHVAQVSVRQGKVNQVISALKGKGTLDDPGILDSEHGTLAILIKNYQDIMDGAQKKMETEAIRLETFKDNLIKKFARLESSLAKYNKINTTLESQVKSLSTSTSK